MEKSQKFYSFDSQSLGKRPFSGSATKKEAFTPDHAQSQAMHDLMSEPPLQMIYEAREKSEKSNQTKKKRLNSKTQTQENLNSESNETY